ncbi:hypothetical protein LCM02_01330 [Lutimonas saemankumensis]|uniref:hypothetical protein n=1 Tax=Lutimonas saemankumensis TaxID=483016 RepID=UPI001CD5567A|nr:hypothetical protein [Lutimonas saemankumensis]MCA0931071.1 hypothetical protein [Lutimonas saemankumensis]
MNWDFTFKKYEELLKVLNDDGYQFQTFEQFIKNPKKKVVVLRHDVDRRSAHSLDLAKAESTVNAKASYYFRIVPESNVKNIIEKIAALGHEIGYHYEDLGASKGNFQKAYERYLKNLGYFRSYYPVSTICMHGSPENKIDNRDIWKKYNYKKNGIIAEPYFDVNYDEVFYITDASRSWNNRNVSVRDKVETKYELDASSIDKMIYLVKNNLMPDQIIINTHPHNWSKFGLLWIYILVWQSMKNVVKAILIRIRK